jgi:hypothetical protein
MISDNDIQRLGRLVRLAPYMNQEQREGLLKLVRDLKAADAAGWMPQSAIQPMVDAVGDQQMRDIVADLRTFGRAQPGGWLDPGKSEPRQAPRSMYIPLEPPPGVAICDQMLDVQDAIDRAERVKGFGSVFGGEPRVVTKGDE